MTSALVPLHGNDGPPARGVVFIHSCPRAVSPHVEWALAHVLQRDVCMPWSGQHAAPGTVRAELSWLDRPGTGAALASALLSFASLRFEVTEEPSAGREGERYSVTPGLGMFRATIGPHGDVVVHEDRLRAAMAEASTEDLASRIHGLLGSEWDRELEPFRFAGESTSVRWLHRVG